MFSTKHCFQKYNKNGRPPFSFKRCDGPILIIPIGSQIRHWVINFLSFYSIILKLGTKKSRHSQKSYFFLKIFTFLTYNDVTSLAPNFGFADMGYLMLLSERTFHKDLKNRKSFKIYQSNQKISVTF